MKATLIKDHLENFTGHAQLYRLEPPIKAFQWDDDAPAKEHEYVIVSATMAMFSGPETYIFPADKDGKVLDFLELPGSFRGSLDHAEALNRAGYSVERA